ncbi:MAG: ABC transporter ATP-binding protein [Candidatus Ratteibacteria bacterium]
MPREIIQFNEVWKTYALGETEVHALRGLSFTLFEGDHVSIMGPSGSGKTTLLNILGCLDRPTQGKYILGNEDISNLNDDQLSDIRSRRLGYIFQSYNLIPQLTVLENIGLPLFYQGIDETIVRDKSSLLAEKVGLRDRKNHRPYELSGGQQQRVAIARALVNEPLLILADEPTGNLDSATGKEIMDMLDELNHEGKTLVLVTHDPKISEHSRRVLRILDGALDVSR